MYKGVTDGSSFIFSLIGLPSVHIVSGCSPIVGGRLSLNK
jgi:hypothetical protein